MDYNWNDIVAQAERFHKASEMLNERDDDLRIVSWTNAAFAIELYYKALYLKNTGNAFRANHDIETIFNNLSKKIQNEIQNDYYLEQKKRKYLTEQINSLKVHYPDISKDFLWNLKQVKSAFLNFRYVYEKKAAAILFYPEIRNSIIKQLEK